MFQEYKVQAYTKKGVLANLSVIWKQTLLHIFFQTVCKTQICIASDTLLFCRNMPLKHQPDTLRKTALRSVCKRFNDLFYGCEQEEDMRVMIESGAYLEVDNPLMELREFYSFTHSIVKREYINRKTNLITWTQKLFFESFLMSVIM